MAFAVNVRVRLIFVLDYLCGPLATISMCSDAHNPQLWYNLLPWLICFHILIHLLTLK